jgi:hypothetical protein
LPQGEQDSLEGLSDDHPITLMGITRMEFENFLTVLYPTRA